MYLPNHLNTGHNFDIKLQVSLITDSSNVQPINWFEWSRHVRVFCTFRHYFEWNFPDEFDCKEITFINYHRLFGNEIK